MNIYEIRRKNLITLKDKYCRGRITELSERLNKNPSYVSRMLYEEGKPNKKNISDKVLFDIETAFNLPRGWLDDLTPCDQLEPVIDSNNIKNDIKKEDGVKIEVLDISASCGNGVITEREFASVLRSIEFTPDFALKLFGRRSTEYIKVITAKGDSMAPTIKSGANIFVDTKINYFDGDGVYVFVFDDEIYVKRIQITGTEIIVLSDNSLYKTWEMKKEFAYKFHIQGKVLLGQNIDYVYFD